MAMRQLSLFDDAPFVKPPTTSSVCQMELFEQGSLGLAQAWEFLRRGDVDAAHSALLSLRQKLPNEPTIREQARLVAETQRRHDALGLLSPKNRCAAMLKWAGEIRQSPGALYDYSSLLIQRAAREWCVTMNDGEPLEGRLPGEWFFLCGALDDAVASFERAAQKRYDARIAFHWGDTLHALGQTGLARHRYRDGLLLDPFHEAWNDVRDTAVRNLPDVVRYEIGIEEDPIAWAAPAGIVLGVLPRPTQIEEAWTEAPTRHESLQRARTFSQLLVQVAKPEIRKNTDTLIDVRRSMKHLCPELFQVVLRGAM